MPESAWPPAAAAWLASLAILFGGAWLAASIGVDRAGVEAGAQRAVVVARRDATPPATRERPAAAPAATATTASAAPPR